MISGGAWRLVTATVTATSADDGCGGRVVRGVGLAEDAPRVEPYVGVDAGGDADVGVAEGFRRRERRRGRRRS